MSHRRIFPSRSRGEAARGGPNDKIHIIYIYIYTRARKQRIIIIIILKKVIAFSPEHGPAAAAATAGRQSQRPPDRVAGAIDRFTLTVGNRSSLVYLYTRVEDDDDDWSRHGRGDDGGVAFVTRRTHGHGARIGCGGGSAPPLFFLSVFTARIIVFIGNIFLSGARIELKQQRKNSSTMLNA